ncbi:glutamic acid-rich protein-like [Sycon ciliatum]|uniref:glutamic acid-rich protein-like n=1 Tax=Sycon ciliatum TaxID=27933 RepID=UPI0031F68273
MYLLVAGAGVDPRTPALTSPTLTRITTPPTLIQRPRRATANYSTEIYARNGQGPRVVDSTNRRRVEQYHESVSEADPEEQLRSRDEQLANGRQVVCTETEDETDDQRMEEELDDETVGEETEAEAEYGSDDDREDDERNEEEDDEMDEEESGCAT